MVTTTWEAFGTRGAPMRFLTRRFLRIYPAYWPALLAFVFIGLNFPTALSLAPVNAGSLLSSFFLVPNATGPLLFLAWTLECEVYFYVVFALALRFSRERLALVFGAWFAIVLAFNVAAHVSSWFPVQFLGNPLALEFMGGGIVGYLVLHKHIFAPRAMLIFGLLIAAGVALYAARLEGFGSLELTWFRVLVAGPAMMLILYGTVMLEQQAKIVVPRFTVALGDASYSLYLWHGMLLGAYASAASRLHPHGRIADAAFIAGAALLVVVGSLTIYRLVELPLIRLAKRAVRASPSGPVAPASVASVSANGGAA
jgi:peptidoglycan/LPS O-acetylase OafA/YrhL